MIISFENGKIFVCLYLKMGKAYSSLREKTDEVSVFNTPVFFVDIMGFLLYIYVYCSVIICTKYNCIYLCFYCIVVLCLCRILNKIFKSIRCSATGRNRYMEWPADPDTPCTPFKSHSLWDH